MRFLRFSALGAFLAVACTGCITFLTEIHLASDGSGTLVQTVSMDPHAAAGAMQEVARGLGGEGSVHEHETRETETKSEGPFANADFAAKAKELGDGVEFVSADPIRAADAEGVRVTYRFRDVRTLYLNPKPGAAMGTEGAGRSSPRALRFRFEKSGGRSILTAITPPAEKKTTTAGDAAPPPAEKADPQQLEMVRRMFKGMRMGLTIDVDGPIVATNASFHEARRVTLIDLDMDRLLDRPETLETLNARLSAAGGDDAKTAEVLSAVPGVKIETKPEVRVEFGR
ncbi:MAG TPA: hypothetical protein VFL12_05845 [Thermoanaerobaculia bacterium]|nr:hypothetical protein [Thermoanaerobaculia bacterium]